MYTQATHSVYNLMSYVMVLASCIVENTLQTKLASILNEQPSAYNILGQTLNVLIYHVRIQCHAKYSYRWPNQALISAISEYLATLNKHCYFKLWV